MKKLLVFLFLVLISCEKEEIIIDTTPTYNMVFESNYQSIKDGQDISFITVSTDDHQLTIHLDNSVVTKEKFTPTLGLNTRKIFTKSLNSGEYKLVLQTGTQILNETLIVVE
jgi:plastocyanin